MPVFTVTVNKCYRTKVTRNDYRLPDIHYQVIPLWDVSFPVSQLQLLKNHSPGLYAQYKKPSHIFGDVRCPILGKTSMPLCRLVGRHGSKAGLNRKLKISNTSNTAYNVDIAQSQVRNYTHRRMQEVNSLCTDSGPIPAEYCIVGIPHNTAI